MSRQEYGKVNVKALVLTDYKKFEIGEMPKPEVGPSDVLVRVCACGICGSDIHGYDGSSGRRIPPLVMGHEAAGIVASTGANARDFQEGDRVTFDSMVSCGQCHFCRRGEINLCDSRRVLGVSCEDYRQHGAFAEFVVVPEHVCYRLPLVLPFEQAAMIEPVSIAVHAVNRSPVALGDTAVVVGSGMIGLLVIQALRLARCSTVIAVDLNEHRLELARSLGADVTLLADGVDVPAEVRKLTDGRGADIVMEVVGSSATLQTSVHCLRKGGSLTLVGNIAPEVSFPLQAVVTRELSLLGSCGSSGEYPRCIELMSQQSIRVEPLITATATLEEGPAWFERLYQGEPETLKVILQPTCE